MRSVVGAGRVLLPATDRGVVMQAVIVVTLLSWAGWHVRDRPEWRLWSSAWRC